MKKKRKKETLGVLKDCAEKHGGEKTLDEIIYELQMLDPERDSLIIERYSEREYAWKNPRLK